MRTAISTALVAFLAAAILSLPPWLFVLMLLGFGCRVFAEATRGR